MADSLGQGPIKMRGHRGQARGRGDEGFRQNRSGQNQTRTWRNDADDIDNNWRRDSSSRLDEQQSGWGRFNDGVDNGQAQQAVSTSTSSWSQKQDHSYNGDKGIPRERGHPRGQPSQNQRRGWRRGPHSQTNKVFDDATGYQNRVCPEDVEVQEQPKPVSRIVGVCDEMCPRTEIILREREGLLHKFETLQIHSPSAWPVEAPSNIGSTTGETSKRSSAGRKSLPKADFNRVIKSFARSAAGQDKTVPEDLRPVLVLKKTVAYLCAEILTRTDSPFPVIYDFIFDRLRAVRQDLVVQRIEDEDAIRILETIVKFHIYSEFRLREEPISTYDPHINQKHLVDCLRKLLSLYEFNDYVEPSRAEFEGLNCLVSISSYPVITRAFSIQNQINSSILNLSIDMALSYQCRNWVRFFRKLSQLPTILQMYCLRHVRVTRETAFRTMCLAYGVNSCKIPLSWITTQLLYNSIDELHRNLGHLSVEIIREEDKATLQTQKYAKFQKSQANVIQSKAAGIKLDIQSLCIQSIAKDELNGTFSVLCF